jgi:hypothetical protein
MRQPRNLPDTHSTPTTTRDSAKLRTHRCVAAGALGPEAVIPPPLEESWKSNALERIPDNRRVSCGTNPGRVNDRHGLEDPFLLFLQGGPMDKKIAGLLGAAAALTAVNSAQASTPAQTTVLATAASYRDLLEPISNPLALLKDDDTKRTEAPAVGGTRLAQHHHHQYEKGTTRISASRLQAMSHILQVSLPKI